MRPQQETEKPQLDAVILLDKAAGRSSAQALYGIKKRLPKGARVGHAGTLDPFATGLLVVLIGRATKLSDYLLKSFKTYSGMIRFGEKTETGDPEGAVIERSEQLPKELSALQIAAQSFVGRPYAQKPPMYSAKKIDGRPLYALARKGLDIERLPIERLIDSFEILSFDGRDAHFRARCSSGTYVRVLAEDLAQRLGTVAHLQSLRREASGCFAVGGALDASSLESMTDLRSATHPAIIPYSRALDDWPAHRKVALPEGAAADIRNGNGVALSRWLLAFQARAGEPIAVYVKNSIDSGQDIDPRLAAIVRWEEDQKPGRWTFSQVF